MTNNSAFQSAFQAVMAEFFEKWEERLAFLEILAADGHDEEATLLACCYVESLGQSLFQPADNESKSSFVRVLVEHGSNPLFGYLHPKQLLNRLRNSKNGKENQLAKVLEQRLESLVGRLYTEEELLEAVQPPLSTADVEWLRSRLWHAKVAAIVYTDVRCPAVHDFPPVNLTFGLTEFQGCQMPDLNYGLLAPALSAILTHCKEVSFGSGCYFGHPFP